MTRRRPAQLARVTLIGFLLAGCAADVRAHAVTPELLLDGHDGSVISSVGDAAPAPVTGFTCEVMGAMSSDSSSSEAATPDD